MASTYRDLLAQVQTQVRTLPIEGLVARLATHEALALIDVRERDEVTSGRIPGAIHIARGVLELEIEAKVPDKAAPVVLYCASGARSALAARTLAELGYANVESLSPGFERWRALGHPLEMEGGLTEAQLTEAQRSRYSRHLRLTEIGEAGQAKLLASKVLLLGVGGLGSSAALYLAAAGVGTLGIVDADVVDASNLQRQTVHATSRVGMPKVDSAAIALADLNPDVTVVKHRERLTRKNVDRLFEGYDVVVDGCDNFPTRYLINDAGVFHAKPVVHGSVSRFDGQITVFDTARGGPCYRCLYPAPPPVGLAPSCQEAGVLGILPGVVGVLQATEALKLLLGLGTTLVGRVVTYDALTLRFGELKLRRDARCPACGDSPTIREYVDYEGFCAA